MHIALLTSSFLPAVGGMEWKVHYLATEYVRAGHDATVIAIRSGLRGSDRKLPVDPIYRVVHSGLTARGFGRFGINVWLNKRAILRENRRLKLDLLHCHPLGVSSYCGVKIRTTLGIPVVVTTSGGDVYVDRSLNYGDRLVPRMDRMIRHTLTNVDVIVSVSAAVHSELAALGTSARIVDIPNGVAWDDFQVPRNGYLRERLNLSPDCLIVLSLGRYTPIKDYGSTLQAFAQIQDRYRNSVLVVVGRGVSCLKVAAERVGLRERLHLIEQVPMSLVPRIMRSADIFINTSLMEGFAQANAQALASGLPCVITDSPGNIDAAKHGGALVARTADPRSIADALAQLIENPQQRELLRLQAHEAGKQYDWRLIARQYLNMFDELVNCKSRPACTAA